MHVDTKDLAGFFKELFFHALGSTAGWWHADVVCLTAGPRALQRMQDARTADRREGGDSSLLPLSAVYMQTCICRRKRSCCQPTSLGALEVFLGVSRGLEEPCALVARQAVTRCWIWYFDIVTTLRGCIAENPGARLLSGVNDDGEEGDDDDVYEQSWYRR